MLAEKRYEMCWLRRGMKWRMKNKIGHHTIQQHKQVLKF